MLRVGEKRKESFRTKLQEQQQQQQQQKQLLINLRKEF